jgi:hypothetical protein
LSRQLYGTVVEDNEKWVQFDGHIIGMMLVIGVVETNPTQQMEEKVETLLGHAKTLQEEGRRM